MRESQATTCHGEQGRSSAIHRFLFSTSTSHLPLYFKNTSASSTTVRGSRSPPQTCISSPTIVLHGALHCMRTATHLVVQFASDALEHSLRSYPGHLKQKDAWSMQCHPMPCHMLIAKADVEAPSRDVVIAEGFVPHCIPRRSLAYIVAASRTQRQDP
jgi:hypothetical protein